MANFRTHYDNLKVTRTAPASVIKAAYKALCQTYHPDKFQGINEDAERIMKLVNTSYTVLIDPVQRALHDEWIKNKEAEATKEQHQKQDKQQSYSSKNESERKRKMWEEWKGPGQSNEQPQNEGRKPPPPPESKSSKNLEPGYYFWRRYFARYLIDYSLCGFLSLFAIAYWVDYGHQIPNWLVLNNYLYWIYISAPLWLVLEPITLSIFGTTPGKALFRLRLVSNNIEPNYWKRSFYVYVVGIGLGLPVISGLTMLYAGSRLKKNGKTDWDKWAGFNIEADPLSLLRKTVIIITLMIMGILVTTTCNVILPVALNPIITQVKENNSHELDDLLQNHATNQDTLNNANSLYDQKRYADALPLFQDLAVQGYSSAQYNLGLMYDYAQGVAQDYTQAAYWYRKASEQGHASAQNNLGVLYENGQGIARDYTQAIYWYRKAAEQGYASAQNNLGVLYENGQGIARDYTQAIYWFRKAAEQGNELGQYDLGIAYANGKGVAQDYAQAIYWYRKAAEQGYVFAQFNLGIACANGQGVKQDYAQAIYWYRKASEQGDALAQYNLGLMYEHGEGVTQDVNQAVYWYRKAAEQGNENAIAALNRLNR
jgi:TPR repeat protein/curved DNA-binding protein CbpA